jgi:NADPH-dependent 2,4-dienoyl-CoA reductase/sulfur reductase-like enzyme/peroxiredoxin family protein/rhodanese-related sulfurtransferase/TusA-related sulfurtransferase
MSKSKSKKILIVGGVAGGAAAAARARRLSEDAEIVLFERGEHISFANCGLPYHIGGVISERDRLLVQTPKAMRDRFRLDVRTGREVTKVDRERSSVTVRDVQTGEESSESYDALILSPGAEPLRPPISGADDPGVFTLRNMGDMDAIKQVVDDGRPSRAVVVGGGYIGLEMVEALVARGVEVTLVEMAEQVFVAADPEMVAAIHDQLRLNGVDLRLGTSVTAIRREGHRLEVALGSDESVEAGLVIMAVGVRPEVTLAREAGLVIGPLGGIAVDHRMQTSDPKIFAVGDAVEVVHLVAGQAALIPLAGPAARQGRIAAENALGGARSYLGTQGTAICKVFDLAVGMTGMNEKALKKAGIAFEKVHVHPASHAGYYPGAMPLSLKLLFSPEDGKILGAQAVGADGVDKRIDVVAVAIRAGFSVRDLAELELCYAPPYGSAKDPVNYAGFAATNVLDGLVRVCHTEDIVGATEAQLLLDVRDPGELEAGGIPGAKNIPLDELRGRLDELPRDRELLVFCQVGLRGYLACRILSQKGYVCRNLSGGYKTYRAATCRPSRGDGPECECGKEKVSMVIDEKTRASEATRGASGPQVVKRIDARALQCPGPIMKLRAEMEDIEEGQAVSILAGDPAFPSDVVAWCASTGHELLGVVPEDGATRATIAKGGCRALAETTAGQTTEMSKHKTLVVFSGDLDKALASFIIANGAAAMGSKVTMFFTFWGINVLRRPKQVAVEKNLIERMFGWMMPRGAGKLKLSKMNMGGMGAAMIKGIMRSKGVDSLPELIRTAREAGVRLVVCSMSMDLMGIRREELIDGIEEGGVATYLHEAEAGNVNLFI